MRPERRLRIFQPKNYLVIDLNHKRIALHQKGDVEIHPGVPRMEREHFRFEKGDALLDQIESFLDCIENNKQPIVDGTAGKKALETAIRITDIVKANNVRHPFPDSPKTEK